jgi:hypothetical protein
LDKPLREQRMLQVGHRFVSGLDGIKFRRPTAAQAIDLREDKPHPMALFSSTRQLGQGDRKCCFLGGDEARQVKRIW